ncbi:hypothetical protein D3C74_409840 [compost metagenome]
MRQVHFTIHTQIQHRCRAGVLFAFHFLRGIFLKYARFEQMVHRMCKVGVHDHMVRFDAFTTLQQYTFCTTLANDDLFHRGGSMYTSSVFFHNISHGLENPIHTANGVEQSVVMLDER